jgi:glutathione S-transferase
MKLYHGALSPFVRKVMASAIELGVEDRLEKVPSPLSAIQPNAGVIAVNPIGKIPALELEDGTPLYDSGVIIEYLDQLADGGRLVPPVGPERWRALRVNALADGLLEAGVYARVETTRPEGMQWDVWIGAQRAKVTQCLDRLEQEVAAFAATPTIGEIATGCALGWLDFRLPDVAWREGRPQLAAWYEGFAARPAMTATAPKT